MQYNFQTVRSLNRRNNLDHGLVQLFDYGHALEYNWFIAAPCEWVKLQYNQIDLSRNQYDYAKIKWKSDEIQLSGNITDADLHQMSKAAYIPGIFNVRHRFLKVQTYVQNLSH